jgi:hypothetical protein
MMCDIAAQRYANVDKLQQLAKKYGTTCIGNRCGLQNGKEKRRTEQKCSFMHLPGGGLMHNFGCGSSDTTDRTGCIIRSRKDARYWHGR